MRAKEEYEKWCALEQAREDSRFGVMQEKAYITGFRRAVQLMEIYLKEKSDEKSIEIEVSRN